MVSKKGTFLSFVIPAVNEEKSISKIYKEITSETQKLRTPFEIIFIDDGSTDQTFLKMKKIHELDKRVKVIKHRGNWGKGEALRSGFSLAIGNIIFTLDADLQDNPNDISRFLKKIDAGYDLVVGWKKTRKDPLSKKISSELYNSLVRFVAGSKLHDVNCGFKCMKREVFDSTPFFKDLFRLLPIIIEKQHFMVGEVVVRHRSRKYGKSKFGFERSISGTIDLLTVFFLTGFVNRPGRFFGSLGIASFGGGFAIGSYITYLRLTTGGIEYRQPLLFLGVLLMIVGIQFVSTGLLAEMIVRFNLDTSKPDFSKSVKILD